MLYHFTSRQHWERIVEDGEIKALSPADLAYEPKVVHLTVSGSERTLPASVVPDVVISIDDDSSLVTTSFLEWYALELPPVLQSPFDDDLRTTTTWPVRPEVHWFVVKGPVPAALWVEARSLVDDAQLWPPPAG